MLQSSYAYSVLEQQPPHVKRAKGKRVCKRSRRFHTEDTRPIRTLLYFNMVAIEEKEQINS